MLPLNGRWADGPEKTVKHGRYRQPFPSMKVCSFCGLGWSLKGLRLRGQIFQLPKLALRGAAWSVVQEGEGAKEGVAGRRELWSGNCSWVQLCSSVLARDHQPPALQPPPRMIPAVILFLLLLVEEAGKRKASASVSWA